jgi:dolichyl-phosphate-mannose-protein mannosyltransferase
VRTAAAAAAVVVCVLAASLLGYAQIRAAGPTFDEPVHLAGGYTDLVVSGYHMHATGHPPLAEMWAALPLLAFRPDIFSSSGAWLNEQIIHYGDLFLYHNRVPSQTLLDAARCWNLVTLTLLLAAALILWARRLGGAPAAWSSAAALAFCVPWLSNASLVTTDALSSVLFFAACALFAAPRRTTAVWALSGAVVGAALAAKFNMILLPPLAGLTLIVEARADRARRPPAAQLALAAAAAALALSAAYRFVSLPLYWKDLSAMLAFLSEGRASYLLGSRSIDGVWWYFPAALLVKTPLPLLILGALGAWCAWRRPRAEAAWLLLPPAGYFLAALTSKTQIGYRHLLPIYPFLCLWAGLGAAWLWKRNAEARVVAAAAGLWLASSVVAASPSYLSYFNELARGRGEDWLSDSNMDWGQDLPALARELAARGNPPVVLSYFGSGDPAAYGIRYVPLAFVSKVERDGDAALAPGGSVLLAVSETNLVGTYYRDHAVFAWLHSRRPAAVPGGSIFLYDLTADGAARARLAAMLAALGRPGDARALEATP